MKQLSLLFSLVFLCKCKPSDVECSKFFIYETKTINIKGISAKLRAERVPFGVSIGEISIKSEFDKASDKLKELDLLQYSLCSQISQLPLTDTATRRNTRQKYIEALQTMMLIASHPEQTQAPLSIIRNPASVVTAIGKKALFTVQANGGVEPYRYTWFVNGDSVQNQNSNSMEIDHLKLNQNNAQISVVIIDANLERVTSDAVTLHITQPFWVSYSTKDPYLSDAAIPLMENTMVNSLFHDSNIVFQLPKEAEGAFWVIKVPVTEPQKKWWHHNDLNYGDIPDIVVRKPFTILNFTYYVSRSAFFFNYRLPIILQQ